MNGYLLVNKPKEWTSFDVVAKIRSEIRKRTGEKIKIGHSGTLDPFATGLLIILVGKYTKQQDEFMKQDKIYEATFYLGATSSTGDPEGEIRLSKDPKVPDTKKIKSVLDSFLGEISQVPPAYSAIKINGKKAYDLARAGKKVELKARKVRIYGIELLNYSWPKLEIQVKVSSGTYIRSLAVDIGAKLGCGAYCLALNRSQIGNYSIKSAYELNTFIDDGIEKYLVSTE
jgi:tRNA pseudouridine55 synthase